MEIKYQGWNGKAMLRVSRIHLDVDGAIWWSPNSNGNPLYNASQYPIRRFTGLEDKNGKEIYEGDIAKITSREAVGEEQHTHRRRTNTYSVYRNIEIVGVIEYLNGAYWLKTSQSVTYKTYFYDMGRHKPTPDWQNVRDFTQNLSRQLTAKVAGVCEIIGNVWETRTR